MNKKFIVPLFVLFISSFFLLSSRVKADTELNSSQISSQISTYINSNFNYLLHNASTYCTNSLDKYVIFIYNNDYYLMCQQSDHFKLYSSPDYLFYYINTGSRTFYKLTNGSLVSSSKPNDTVVLMSSSTDFLNMSSILYYSNNITSFRTPDNNTYYFTYGSNTYYFKSYKSFPSLYSIYLDNYTPPDTTPLLTSFIDISIEKLAVICSFITSSYIYLAPFVILIFYFVILLFRRFR